MDLAGSHYAAICMEKENSAGGETQNSNVINMWNCMVEVFCDFFAGEASVPMRLTVWKTIPFVEDERVSGTGAVVPISGLIKQL